MFLKQCDVSTSAFSASPILKSLPDTPGGAMNFVVLGNGKTGSLVAEIAKERGHNVLVVTSAQNKNGAALTADSLGGVDAVIDFTTPEAAVPNIEACTKAGANIVVGTTGWYKEL